MEHPKWKPQSLLVTAPELPKLAARHRIIVLHCGASWNRLDLPYDALMQEMNAEFSGQIAFFALDVDEETNWEFLQSIGVVNVAFLACLKDGVLFRYAVGMRPKEKLREILREWRDEAHQTGRERPVW